MRIPFLIFSLTLYASANAVQIPVPSGGDSRVGYIDYDPDEVIQVTGKIGYQTTVFFAKDEVIQDLGAGFPPGWEIGPLKEENGFVIKPADQDPNTNLVVVTNKRMYSFDLFLEPAKENKDKKRQKGDAGNGSSGKHFYFIKFRYPVEMAKKHDEGKEQSRLATSLATANRGKRRNEEYWIQGPETLQPIAAWDNGEFTYLKFGPNTGMPAVYGVDASDKEYIAQSHIEDDTLVVHEVSKKIIIRRDGKAAAIFNEAYDSFGVENPTKTISTSVRRIVKNGKEDEQTYPISDSSKGGNDRLQPKGAR